MTVNVFALLSSSPRASILIACPPPRVELSHVQYLHACPHIVREKRSRARDRATEQEREGESESESESNTQRESERRRSREQGQEEEL